MAGHSPHPLSPTEAHPATPEIFLLVTAGVCVGDYPLRAEARLLLNIIQGPRQPRIRGLQSQTSRKQSKRSPGLGKDALQREHVTTKRGQPQRDSVRSDQMRTAVPVSHRAQGQLTRSTQLGEKRRSSSRLKAAW